MKISDFLKTLFFSIIFTFIDDFTLNSDIYKGNLKFWTLLAFIGLHWPFWPLWPWIIFLSKNRPLMIKIKHNWTVSNIQISKSISKGSQAVWNGTILPFWFTFLYSFDIVRLRARKNTKQLLLKFEHQKRGDKPLFFQSSIFVASFVYHWC